MRNLVLSILLCCLQLVAAAGSVDTVRVYSHSMKKEIKAVIIQPIEKGKGISYPVLYLLHGFGGNSGLWITKVPELQQLADKYGCVIVCPDAGYTTLYFDNPLDSNSRFETHFISELMPFVESHYPVSRERKYRAISGLSMGGFGAFFLASRHMELFGAAGSMSGVLDLKPFSGNKLAVKQGIDSTCCSVNWDNFIPPKVSDSTRHGQTRLIIDCGLDDYLLAVNRNVHKRLANQKIAHDYTERPGRHEWGYWKNAIEFQLLFFRKGWDEN